MVPPRTIILGDFIQDKHFQSMLDQAFIIQNVSDRPIIGILSIPHAIAGSQAKTRTDRTQILIGKCGGHSSKKFSITA